jgi:hypothetical protein
MVDLIWHRMRDAVLALAVPCAATLARAAPLGAELAVERSAGAEDCPAGAELTARVERILQRPLPPNHPDAEPLRIAVEFAKSSAGYTAALHFRGPKTGERHLLDRGGSCEALAEAVSVTIALSLDQQLEQRAAERESKAAPDVGPKAPRIGPKSSAAPPARAPRGVWEAGMLVEGGTALGFGAPAAFALSEHAQARIRRRWLFDLGFHAVAPSTVSATTGRVRTSWLFGSARGCHVWGEDYLVGACALLGVGRLRGVGVGYHESRSDDLTWSAVGGAGTVQGPLVGPAFWALSGTLWRPLRSLTFSVQNAGVVWRASPVSGTVGLAVGVHFRPGA